MHILLIFTRGVHGREVYRRLSQMGFVLDLLYESLIVDTERTGYALVVETRLDA